MSKKVIVGLSGGVDSSVAALQLLNEGWDVEGLFMKNWEEDDDEEYCSATVDLKDAQGVADKLGIKLHTVNFSGEYWDNVFEYFLTEYKKGRTPNPDVLCNREIKFKAFLNYALDLGADYIATGHYADITFKDDQYHLTQAVDQNKDQTYFLYMLNQHALAHSLFPLAKIPKDEVRVLAEKAGFDNHKKKDSTGICFIGERRFRDFLSQYLPAKTGPIVDTEGKEISTHQGVMYYTMGQRQGLGIGGVQGQKEEPWFVVGKDIKTNTLKVAQGHQHPLLLAKQLIANQLHWTTNQAPSTHFHCLARCRHRQPLQECQVEIKDDVATVNFTNPQRALTPGQSIVFYDDAICLGGGIITDVNQ